MFLHFFYPENDLALAANVARYTAPGPARRLSEAGRVLPLWYGNPGDKVLCYGVNASWLHEMRTKFEIETDIFNHIPTPELRPAPWGWSLASRQVFLDEGYSLSALPSDERIAMLRALSHRRTALGLASSLRADMPGISLPPAATEAFSPEEAEQAMRRYGQSVVKLPWSSSGRGVAATPSVGYGKAFAMAANGIRTQGSVIIEPWLDQAVDFAALYTCSGGKCAFAGTSVFATDGHGHYKGNVLASEERRRARLAPFIAADTLSAIIEKIRGAIEKTIAPHYTGALGVDMLVDKSGMLHPTVELNLRMTMGHVANSFAEKYLAPEATGTFEVRQLRGEAPLAAYECEGGRLARGALMLTPPNPHFAFIASVG